MNNAAVPRGTLYRVLIALWFSLALNYLDRQSVFSIFPALQRDLGLSRAVFGAAGTLFIWIYSLSMPLTGRLADTASRPAMIIGSVALWSCATLGTALSHSPLQFLFWRAMMGFTEALYIPAALGWIGALFPTAIRSRALATHATAQFAGVIAGSWWGGWSADHIGWRTGFRLAALGGFAWAVVLWISLRGIPDLVREPSHSAKLSVITRPFVLLAASFFCLALMIWVLYAWLPSSLLDRFHISMTESGFLAAASLQTSAIVGVLTGGFLGDFLARREPAGRLRTAAVGLLISAPCFFLIFRMPSLALTSAAACGFGLFSGLFIANIFAIAFDMFDQRRHSSAAAILNATAGVAGGLGIFISGVLESGIQILTIFVGVLSIVIALTMLTPSKSQMFAAQGDS